MRASSKSAVGGHCPFGDKNAVAPHVYSSIMKSHAADVKAPTSGSSIARAVSPTVSEHVAKRTRGHWTNNPSRRNAWRNCLWPVLRMSPPPQAGLEPKIERLSPRSYLTHQRFQ